VLLILLFLSALSDGPLAMMDLRGEPSDKGGIPVIDLSGVETAVTENGIRLVYIRDELPRLTLIVSIGFGSLYENRKNAGYRT